MIKERGRKERKEKEKKQKHRFKEKVEQIYTV